MSFKLRNAVRTKMHDTHDKTRCKYRTLGSFATEIEPQCKPRRAAGGVWRLREKLWKEGAWVSWLARVGQKRNRVWLLGGRRVDSGESEESTSLTAHIASDKIEGRNRNWRALCDVQLG